VAWRATFALSKAETVLAARQNSEAQPGKGCSIGNGAVSCDWQSAREEGPGSRSHGGERESLKGENARRAFGVRWASAPRATPVRREQTSEADDHVLGRGPTAWEEQARRRAWISGRSKALKAKAQERFRGETNPDGWEGAQS